MFSFLNSKSINKFLNNQFKQIETNLFGVEIAVSEETLGDDNDVSSFLERFNEALNISGVSESAETQSAVSESVETQSIVAESTETPSTDAQPVISESADSQTVVLAVAQEVQADPVVAILCEDLEQQFLDLMESGRVSRTASDGYSQPEELSVISELSIGNCERQLSSGIADVLQGMRNYWSNNGGQPREVQDLYITPVQYVVVLLALLETIRHHPDVRNTVNDPTWGTGAIGSVFENAGWQVCGTDKYTMHKSIDMLTDEWSPLYGLNVTNTPFGNKDIFLQKLINTGLPTCALFPLESLGGIRFSEQLQRLPSFQLIILNKKYDFVKSDGSSVHIPYVAWFCFNFPEGYFPQQIMYAFPPRKASERIERSPSEVEEEKLSDTGSFQPVVRDIDGSPINILFI